MSALHRTLATLTAIVGLTIGGLALAASPASAGTIPCPPSITDSVERLCREHGIPPERTHVHQGSTRQLLLTLTEQLRADAVVMGAVSRSGLKGLFLGNTAEDVLDRLHSDLIIVKPDGFRAVLSG